VDPASAHIFKRELYQAARSVPGDLAAGQLVSAWLYAFARVNCPTSEMFRRKKSEHPVR
jgi:hypothetical protein